MKLLQGYDLNNVRIATLGGHSALDVCRGAKKEGYETVVVTRKDRAKTYDRYYKTRGEKGCVDHIIYVDSFGDIIKPEIQKQLRDLNAVFVNSRYFWVYCDNKAVESDFDVPILGNRILVRKEERDEEKNQYFLLKEAGITIPKQYKDPKDIDRLVIVKAAEEARSYERAFFLVNNYEDYKRECEARVKNGSISEAGIARAIIEEFVLGPQLNLNFFFSALSGQLELLGTDTRRQTNIDGLLRLTAKEQIEVLKHVQPKYIENGHQAVTIKESLLEKAFDAGERFVEAVAKHYPPGMIGPFALQGAITAGPPKEELYVFDVSMRIPGSPGSMFTPYSGYLYGDNISFGQRIAMEVKQAISENKLDSIIT
ncbi:DUF1297 domain-containing protein [Candidatus Parcubacteria bacterium]|nr:DUF1297 domain-containing protein [Candidatus Parcubacteria bacterium]